MRTYTMLILAGIAILAVVGGCRETEQEASEPDAADKSSQVSATPPGHAGQAPATQGKVVETMNSGGYTYVKVNDGRAMNWYAGPATSVAVGDTVVLPPNPMTMKNFESKSLGRTFDLIYFVNSIRKPGEKGAASPMKKSHGKASSGATDVDLTGIEKAEGGMTVAEVFAAGKGAAGQQVVLRGKVVKYNSGILGKNWLHVRDGTGEAGTNDITVTTLDKAKVGDTVLVTGKLAADRDFGMGYEYPLMIEDAKVVIE